MKRIIAMAVAAMLPAAFAQDSQKDATPPASNKVVLSRGQTIQSAVTGMAKAAGVLVAVDPRLNGRVSEATSRLPLEQGLGAIATANRAQWRKVYLAENEIPRSADGSIDANRLAATVRDLTAVKTVNAAVVDPATGQMTVVTRALESSPAMAEWAKTRKPVYVLYLPVQETAPPPGAAVLPPGGPEELRNMTPEQRAQWMKEHGGVFVSSDMSPEERARALQNLPPEERARIEEKMNQAGQNGGTSQIMIMRKESIEPQPQESEPGPGTADSPPQPQ